MTPDDVFETHIMDSSPLFGEYCTHCAGDWPCDTYQLAAWAAEQRALSAEILADLVTQRDALLAGGV